MKFRITILTITIFYPLLNLLGQIDSKDKHIIIDNPAGLDRIFFFTKIDANTELTYKGSATTVKWFKFLNGTKTEISNQSYIYPENNTGYILKTDNKEISFWVYDYSKYIPEFKSFAATDSDFPCSLTDLVLNADVPEFIYQNPSGAQLSLKREFTIKYQTLKWKKTNWVTTDTTFTVKLPNKKISISAPLTNTAFTIIGDQYAQKLNVSLSEFKSDTYIPKAVKCNITTITSTRDALNENRRPVDVKQLDGSAPLNIQFFSNATSNTSFYEWQIFKNGELLITRYEQEHEYKFEQSGNYKVKLKVKNQFCSDSAFVDVLVTESKIYAPRVFTPNGDGLNDEFRVAYQSIIEFQGIIKNRWGRVLFSWNNPAKGWDGTVNGKPVPEGTYFYIIKARGADGVPYTLKGHINLFR